MSRGEVDVMLLGVEEAIMILSEGDGGSLIPEGVEPEGVREGEAVDEEGAVPDPVNLSEAGPVDGDVGT